MEKKRLLFIIKFLTIFVVVSILVWMIFAGGCLHKERVRLNNSSVKISVNMLWMSLGIFMNILILLCLAFQNRTYLLLGKRSMSLSFHLLN